MPIITICSLKGGVGKTTSSVFLAAAASERHGFKTLLVDSDPQASAAEWVETRPIEGVDVLEAPSIRLLERLDGAKTKIYDLVIIDTPPVDNPPGIIAAACERADAIIIPTRPGGLEPTRVLSTLRLIPRNTPRGIVVVAARVTNNTAETLSAWYEAKVPIWGVVPLRAQVEAGPTAEVMNRSAMLAYDAILIAALESIDPKPSAAPSSKGIRPTGTRRAR